MDKNFNVEEMNFENNEIVEEIVNACENADTSGEGSLLKVLLGLGLSLAAIWVLFKNKRFQAYLTARRIKKLEKQGYIVAHESEMMDCEEVSEDNNVEEAENY